MAPLREGCQLCGTTGLQARVYKQAYLYDMYFDGLTMTCAGPAAPER